MKRQSVWLSTMMVLALMLIGYYTVNNNVKMVPVTDNSSTDQPAGTAPSDQSAAGQKSGNQDQAKAASSDFFVKMNMNEQKQEAAYIQSLQQILANSKSSSQDIANAQQKLQQISDMQAKADHVRDMLQAAGYPDALVLPNDSDGIHFDHVVVYVQAANLTSDQAVAVMNVVHTQMGVPSENISVGYHA